MKVLYVAGLLVLFALVLAACGIAEVSGPAPVAPAAAVQVAEPTVTPARASLIEIAVPAATPEPTRVRPYRSYPAPTGEAGFRKYYQKRCYPGCHYGSAAPTPTEAPEEAVRERPYRSYPAPTGEAGFRKYYQKRCYPGCHYDSSTPVPTKIHP
jgi:hypothetical protein